MNDRDNRILIAGGGIGGLAAALGLARAGVASHVMERSAGFGEIGAGIQIAPNAFHAFDYLGIGEAARARAVYIDKLRLMDAMSGEEITHIPLGEDFRRRFANPYAVVHRGDLYAALIRACEDSPHVTLQANTEVIGYERAGDGVRALLKGGGTVSGSALIGADGLWSKIRAQLAGDGPPRVSGHTTYRSVIPVEDMPEELRWNAAALWAGPRCHIVHYPLSGWKLFNLVVTYHNDAPEPVAGKPVTAEEVARGFEHIHPRARRIIGIGRNWKLWVLCDRDPILNWTDGPVTLLGDAAHPMLQYFAQGACMALEDAVCLSDCIARTDGDIAAAFKAYNARRIDRTARVQLQSRAIGDHIYHPAGAHAHLRNGILSAMSAEDHYRNLHWLYAGNGLNNSFA